MPNAAERQLIVFAREPRPGACKTRLCPPLSHTEAAALYARMLADLLDSARRVPGARLSVAYTPDSDGAYFAALAPDLAAWPQRGAGLGERMDAALAAALAAGGPRSAAVLIGSDLPSLPAAHIAGAFAALEAGVDLALGPADDGGYYLIGLRARQPRLLREVPMSTPTVLTDTLALAESLGLRPALLPPWYDVDGPAELRRLAAELRVAPPTVAPRTRAYLAELGL